MFATRRNTGVAIVSIVLATVLPSAVPGNAAEKSILPIAIGAYLTQPANGGCNVPDALGWNGKGFIADYVYLDNIIEVRKIGENAFAVKSLTKTDDENTAKSGKIWLGIVKIENSGAFEFKQYSARQNEKSEAYTKYHLCRK